MINDGINNIPEDSICLFPIEDISRDRIDKIFYKMDKKRDWFSPHFYNCLPLTVGNQYGFTIASEYDFEVMWDGGNYEENLLITYPNGHDGFYPKLSTTFGYGILTIELPFIIRTSSGINMMTINTPNSILPNITPMTGVVETDNLRFTMTINLKMQIPGIPVRIIAGTPLATIMPMPRYFQDNFTISYGSDIFDASLVDQEKIAYLKALDKRQIDANNDKPSKDYLKGRDVYGNKFNDHQGPTIKIWG
jgi:hypothetical protein